MFAFMQIEYLIATKLWFPWEPLILFSLFLCCAVASIWDSLGHWESLSVYGRDTGDAVFATLLACNSSSCGLFSLLWTPVVGDLLYLISQYFEFETVENTASLFDCVFFCLLASVLVDGHLLSFDFKVSV